jgi:chromate transport protein ChrA
MSLYNIAASAAGHLAGRLARRALAATVMTAFATVALYHFTIAGKLALATRFSDLQTQLIVAGIYAAVSAAILASLWVMRRSQQQKPAPALAQSREMKLAMLVEAAMLGFELARKGTRSR